MARLRYNGLSTTLGGSLTNVATSVTFAAALTHSNGTNVPTIVAPDYIPLAILGATGHLSEIVYLTAYTAAATTGTITRGVEGTAGAAHSSGDVVTQAPLTSDYTGEGGGDYFRSGYYYSGLFSGAAFTTLALTLNQLLLHPFWVPARRGFDRIGLSVQTAATAASGGVLRMGIYGTTGGVPTTLLADAGTISSESTGSKELTISLTLDPGIYWIGAVAQVAVCTVRTFANFTTTPFFSDQSTAPTSVNQSSVAYASVSGALSGTLSAPGGTGGAQPLAVHLRAT